MLVYFPSHLGHYSGTFSINESPSKAGRPPGPDPNPRRNRDVGTVDFEALREECLETLHIARWVKDIMQELNRSAACAGEDAASSHPSSSSQHRGLAVSSLAKLIGSLRGKHNFHIPTDLLGIVPSHVIPCHLISLVSRLPRLLATRFFATGPTDKHLSSRQRDETVHQLLAARILDTLTSSEGYLDFVDFSLLFLGTMLACDESGAGFWKSASVFKH